MSGASGHRPLTAPRGKGVRGGTELDHAAELAPHTFGIRGGVLLEPHSFDAAVGQRIEFVQDNHSRSSHGVLRGLHYQLNPAQGKLVRVAIGTIFDVAVDIRRSSATFGKWVAAELSSDNQHQLWIPPGFAHGFLVLSETADVLYKATAYYDTPSDRSMLWNDPEIGIEWPVAGTDPVLSDKDRNAVPLAQADLFD